MLAGNLREVSALGKAIRANEEVAMACAVSPDMGARGVVFIHSCPRALIAHVEWAVARCLGVETSFSWTPQSVAPGMFRAEMDWFGRAGAVAALASQLRGYPHLRFEITEDHPDGSPGRRFACTPALGMFQAGTDANGDMLVGEERLRAALVACSDRPEELPRVIQDLLGRAWDDELEPFRIAGADGSVRWLHRVG